tara:strand:- start:625 stop:1050 length:426 start_codon:yes stop_codon:yes gene_type:complete
MNIKSIKKSIGIFSRAAVTSINWPPIKNTDIKCSIDKEVVDCKTFKDPEPPFTGVPAPDVLKNDPWFGEPIMSEKQKEIVSQDIVVNMDGGVGGSWKVNSEPDNIHELMYDMATKHGKTTTQLDPVGGSENFQGGSENIQA